MPVAEQIRVPLPSMSIPTLCGGSTIAGGAKKKMKMLIKFDEGKLSHTHTLMLIKFKM
jgi:hypothetical protein